MMCDEVNQYIDFMAMFCASKQFEIVVHTSLMHDIKDESS